MTVHHRPEGVTESPETELAAVAVHRVDALTSEQHGDNVEALQIRVFAIGAAFSTLSFGLRTPARVDLGSSVDGHRQHAIEPHVDPCILLSTCKLCSHEMPQDE
eukprot:CAMPEP_0206042728 /NCGR_PEP_ID=MMETSP1466-20131121/6730_1 /ASSEMBLY_ACC=CAM_ASM_001126 /TAXON_ID=44452 /ORGANISM="Pavlova gyrans, Strain CCMP608" /LENGTH=103 /DNA_ID=CAMNT_0053417443 /DNA_START=108 /DNA_END=416 /DNA_ORIENTATION=+